MAILPSIPIQTHLEELFASPVRLRIAKAVVRFPDKQFTGRELARMTGVSHTTASREAEELSAMGLVHIQVIGRAYVITANRDSVLFQSVQEWVKVEEALRAAFVRAIREPLEGACLSATIFGSYAAGTADSDSDLDLLVVTDTPKRTLERLHDLVIHVLRRFGVRVSPRVLTPSEVRRKGSPSFVRSARDHGITVAGKTLAEVMG